VRTAGGRR